jgi:hypothetical protein
MASVVDDGGNWKHRFCSVKRKIAIETEKRIGLVFIRWPWWDRLPERFFFAKRGSSSWRQESEENVLVIN